MSFQLLPRSNSEPIVTSLLDVDFYKFTMGNFIYKHYRDVIVTFGMKNRTSTVRLADCIDEHELRAELDHVMTSRFTQSEIYYLRGMDVYGKNMFSEEYLEFLKNMGLPAYELQVIDGQFDLRFTGPWAAVSLWETIALGIVNELYYRALLRDKSRFQRQAIYADGIRRLHDKIEVLKKRPRIKFIEFGTRRRFGRVWQRDITRALSEELPRSQLLGTSNTELAHELGIIPMGTSAHELPMVRGALARSDAELIASTEVVLDQWFDLYGVGLSIALPDTFGSEFFFKVFGEERARKWKGTREDSADPLLAGIERITYYRKLGIDPKTKLWLPSDGLDLQKILDIDDRYGDQMNISYGWGTTLTNDLGLPTLSLVAKAIAANGQPTVKLSDNLAKAMGPAKEIVRYKGVFGYTETHEETCRV
ncbi:MAG: nicotinate phosphoribosyltransferase [Patescibacteria group bacterium]